MFIVYCKDKKCFQSDKPLMCNFCDKGTVYVTCKCGARHLIEGTTWRYFTCKECGLFIRPTEHTMWELRKHRNDGMYP